MLFSSALLRVLPRHIRIRLFRALSADFINNQAVRTWIINDFDDHRLLVDIAREKGIIGFIADGKCGNIRSSIEDRFIFPTYAKTGTWSEFMLSSFEEFFAHEGGTYLDIGANIGLTVLPVAKNPAVKCIAFEPEPTNFFCLTENVARNASHKNVELYNTALFSRRDILSFSLADDFNLGDHRISFETEMSRQTIQVQARPLNELADQISGRLAVKIDTQGAEPFIVAGGRQVLDKADLLVMEFCPFMINRLHGDVSEIFDLIADFSRIGLATWDQGPGLAYHDAELALLELRKVYETNSNDPSFYLDIYAHR